MCDPAGRVALTPLSTRYAPELADAAREYARSHRLSLQVVLAAALAEYLARRADTRVAPAPQLHWRRGRPSGKLIDFQARLMKMDGRGRKLTANSARDELPWDRPHVVGGTRPRETKSQRREAA